jgi:hypothetical protein
VFEFAEYGGCVGILMSCIKNKLENKRNWYNVFFNRGEEDEAWQANEQMLVPSGIACRGFSWRKWNHIKFCIMKKFNKAFTNKFVSLFFLFHKKLS